MSDITRQYGIITHYDVHNHGAVLQLTAMVRLLAVKGIKAKALRFDKNYDFMGRALKAKYDISLRSMGIYLGYLREKGIGCTLYNYRKRRTLNQFKTREGLVGAYYSESPELDAVIVGSDEVFALHTGPTPVFFGHCLPTNHVFSYGGSFGPTTVDDIRRLHSEAFVCSGIASMDYVTVRDTNSRDNIYALTGKEVPVVVDPVILYGFADEIAHLPKPDMKDYLLVYAYDNRMNSPEEVAAIREYARSRGLRTVSPGFYHSWCDYNIDVDPIGLLGWFRHAKGVVTDTFHGSVMSLITEAPFAVKTRESNHFKLSNLLGEYGLKERIFTDWNDLESIMSSAIDYETVGREIRRRRGDSMNHLDAMIRLEKESAGRRKE